jgi:hypothetical protein
MARKGWLAATDVLNARELPALQGFVAGRRTGVAG